MKNYLHIQGANSCIKACSECVDICREFMTALSTKTDIQQTQNRLLNQCKETASHCHRCIEACKEHRKECNKQECQASCEATMKLCWNAIRACQELSEKIVAEDPDLLKFCQNVLDACTLCLQACDHCVEQNC